MKKCIVCDKPILDEEEHYTIEGRKDNDIESPVVTLPVCEECWESISEELAAEGQDSAPERVD